VYEESEKPRSWRRKTRFLFRAAALFEVRYPS
jgi:hypothetical protein